uniref:Small glutamine-rich tetratricopeptide repeat-containing protein alpha n=1 Tax=Panagrolaimus sp. PS1159 TaxID=55785 RepID=A0AC35F5G7_9BILA
IQNAQTLIGKAIECVKASKFNDAIEKYNEAIKLNPDPSYFCNRAAAFCYLKQYDLAIQDCRSALEIDDKCAKAYGRMGLAYYYQNHMDASLEAHETALAIDPFYMLDEEYKNHLDVLEEKLNEAKTFCSTLFGGTGGIADFSDCMNNEYIMEAAKEMMKDPNIQKHLESMLEQFMGGTAEGGSFNDLVTAGQDMAQQMQQANLQLLERLRNRFGSGTLNEDGYQNRFSSSSEEGSSQTTDSNESI